MQDLSVNTILIVVITIVIITKAPPKEIIDRFSYFNYY